MFLVGLVRAGFVRGGELTLPFMWFLSLDLEYRVSGKRTVPEPPVQWRAPCPPISFPRDGDIGELRP